MALLLEERGGYSCVVAAYLELAEPDIRQGAEACLVQGAERVIMLPYFLASGMHVTRDLEEHRQALQARYPQVTFKLGEPLGGHPLLVEILLQRAAAALI